ncbi:MAG: hypothetical protein LC624_01500 [Halobacteriales archaeon]|nr:hypothetical protein [Halobacteriales archaeon]
MDAPRAFQETYERLDREVYARRLPPWPGARVVDTFDVLTAVNAVRYARGFTLQPFTVSAHVRDPALLQDAFRHETAHVGAMLFDGHWEHGLPWQRHAARCGANPTPTHDGSWATR